MMSKLHAGYGELYVKISGSALKKALNFFQLKVLLPLCVWVTA
jgi:hypothetical protein